MIRNAAYFLVGCLVIIVVVYIGHMMLELLELPAGISQFAYVILGLLGLVAFVYLAYRIFAGAVP